MEDECMHNPIIEDDGVTVCADCGEVLYDSKGERK